MRRAGHCPMTAAASGRGTRIFSASNNLVIRGNAEDEEFIDDEFIA